MIPILFPYNSTDFTNHGIGDLVKCISATAAMSDTGERELEFTYPVDGDYFDEIKLNNIVLAKASHYEDPQAFRIYKVEKVIKGTVRVFCEHISYDISWIPVRPFSGNSAANALTNMKNSAAVACPFTFITNVTESGTVNFSDPVSMRAALLDGDSSIKGTYGGDLVFNNYQVSLLKTGGADRGVVIEYGIDLVDLTQEVNNTEMITGILPYYHNSETDSSILGAIQYASGTFERHRIECVDLSEHFPNSVPTAAQLEAKAREWMVAEEIGEPEINLKVSYAWLGQDVRLHDAVTVKFPKMGIDVKAKVTKYTYNVLAERPIEIEVGKTKEAFLFSLDDASRLKRGLLPPERIQNGSLTSNKYADGSITTAKYASSSIPSRAYGAASIPSSAYGNASIPTSAYGANSVNSDALGNEAVITSKLHEGSVLTSKLGENAVDTSKIKDAAVTYGKSAYTATLDQVGTNKSSIASIRSSFENTLFVNNLTISQPTFAMGNYRVYVDSGTGYLRVTGI